MIVGNIDHELTDKEAKVKNIIKTKILKVKYSKLLNSLSVLLRLTKYKSFYVLFSPHFPLEIEQGRVSLGIDFLYRLKNVDHIGFNVEINLIFVTVEIECTDFRHVEDYGKE